MKAFCCWVAVATCWIVSTAAAQQPGAGDVRAFGAIGDGVADDTAAIQRAVNSGVGRVVFAGGAYRIVQPIIVELQSTGFIAIDGGGTSRIVMDGPGPALHFRGTHAGTADPPSMKPDVWQRQRMPSVRALEIVGNHPEADGIEATGSVQLTLAEMLIRRCRHAVHLTERNRNIILSACHLYDNTGCGVFYDHVDLHQSNLVGCHISYCGGGGVVFRGGNVRNVHIGTCDIESNMSPDAPSTANVLIDCTDGSTAEVAIVGCTLQHNSKSPDSANIRVLGRGVMRAKDATPTDEGHITIVGNVMSDVTTNVHLSHVRGATITGNTFWQAKQHDLLLEDCSSIVIGNNNLDRNPRYPVSRNRADWHGGVTLRSCADCKLSGLLVKGVSDPIATILLDHCQRTTVNDCSVLDHDATGLRLVDCTRTLVTNCIVRDDRDDREATSLDVQGGVDNWIHGNVFAGKTLATPDAAILESNR